MIVSIGSDDLGDLKSQNAGRRARTKGGFEIETAVRDSECGKNTLAGRLDGASCLDPLRRCARGGARLQVAGDGGQTAELLQQMCPLFFVVEVDERGQIVGGRILRGCGLGVQMVFLWSSHKPIIQDNAALWGWFFRESIRGAPYAASVCRVVERLGLCAVRCLNPNSCHK